MSPYDNKHVSDENGGVQRQVPGAWFDEFVA